MEAIYAAVILVIGTVIGACIQAFGMPMLSRHVKKQSNTRQYLWRGTWVVDTPEDRKQTIHDEIRIEILPDKQIIGSGNAKGYGKYEIRGRDSRFAMILYYFGIAYKEDVAGVAFIPWKPKGDKLKGNWTQLDSDGAVLDGTVVLERIDI